MRLIYIKLAWIAAKCVMQTMIEGKKTHPGESGFKLSKKEQIEHAALHLPCEYEGDMAEDHIAHALTRCAMIKYLEGKINAR